MVCGLFPMLLNWSFLFYIYMRKTNPEHIIIDDFRRMNRAYIYFPLYNVPLSALHLSKVVYI